MKFIHTADLQLGKPYHLIDDEAKRAFLWKERFNVIDRIGAIAREHEAEFVVIAGDLFDSITADRKTIAAACSAIGSLGLPVYAIPGNHDHGGLGTFWHSDLFRDEVKKVAPNFHLMLHPKPVELETAVLLPCPLLRRETLTDPTLWLRNDEVFVDLPADKPRIVLAHGGVHGFSSSEDSQEVDSTGNILQLDELPGKDVDYFALGDWHGMKEVQANAWYSGTPEFDRFPKGERHQQGKVLVVDAFRGQIPKVKPIQSGKVSWKKLRFDFTGLGSFTAIEDYLDSQLSNRVDEDVLQLTISGAIGVDDSGKLEELISNLEAKVLRLKLINETTVMPSEPEVQLLLGRTSDPLIQAVARELHSRMEEDRENQSAQAAFQILFHQIVKGDK